jgi:hypothetical protein
MSNYSEIIISIVNDTLIDKIRKTFSDFSFDPNDYEKPMRHLNNKLIENCLPFERKSEMGSYKNLYKIKNIDENYGLYLEINPFGLSISILDLKTNDNNENTNYISMYRETKKRMYMYSIKTNGKGPTVSGNTFNQIMFNVCKEMYITQVFISDSASVKCYWDNSIDINHFSLMRVIIGKPTFYSSIPGNFANPEAALNEIKILQEGITNEEKQFILDYLEKKPQINNSSCNDLNKIIQKASNLLSSYPEIYKYIATPYVPNIGGRKKIKKYKSKKNKKYKKRKSIKNKYIKRKQTKIQR